MSTAITAANANREFSALLRGVRRGESFVVTSHGRPIARVVPVSNGSEVREAARSTLFARLRNNPARSIGHWTREDLYDER